MSESPKFDLSTSEGGRGYIAHLFKTVLKRHDFTAYITERLAADFACALARHFEGIKAREAALQQRLTAADERADVLEGLVGEVLDAVGREPLDLDAVLRLRARMRAALKPAEVGADSCEFCKGWGFRSNPDGADEGCGACNGTGKEPSDDQQ